MDVDAMSCFLVWSLLSVGSTRMVLGFERGVDAGRELYRAMKMKTHLWRWQHGYSSRRHEGESEIF